MIFAKLIARIFLLCAFFTASAHAALPIQTWQSATGAKVYFVENHDLPILDVEVNFAAGSSFDHAEKAGLAAMTHGLLGLGAGGLGEDQIANRFADIGAQMGGDFDMDRAAVSLRTLSSARERAAALELMAAIIQKPDFPASVLEREKARAIAGLREAATQPESIGAKAFTKALFGSHPYALGADMEPETLEKITRDDMVAFYRSHYTRNTAVVAIIGDVTREQAEAIAAQLTAELPQGASAEIIPPVPLPDAAVEKRIPHPAEQSHILIGYPGMKRGDADYFPLYVGNYILGGGGFVAMLTEEVREKRGLAYSVYSYFMPMREAGAFQIGLQTKRDQTDAALGVVRETLNKFIQSGPTDAQLKAAKDNIIGGFPLRMDSNGKILDYLSVIGFYGLPLTYLDDFNSKVGAVTAQQVKDAFARRVQPDKMVTVIVGGGAK
ncbi:MAG: insulinase family protein [Methylobacillus sp.]|nr:insulinase family protein [Methylobacillus sp.]